MQAVSFEQRIPDRLTCSGCRHWEQIAADARADVDEAGRCGRFGDTRPASSRPRCNICWEPVVVDQSRQEIDLADG